jgi:hypothetical protein
MKTLKETKTTRRNETTDKILIWKNDAPMQSTRQDAERLAKQLNEISALHTIYSPEDIFPNVDNYVLEKVYQADPLVKEIQARIGGGISSIKNIPDDLQALRIAFNNWYSTDKRNLKYVSKTKQGFIVNTSKMEQDWDADPSMRVFAETEDQLARLDMCRRFMELLDELGLPPESYIKHFNPMKSPFVKCNAGSYVMNKEFILTGTLEPSGWYVDSTYCLL